MSKSTDDGTRGTTHPTCAIAPQATRFDKQGIRTMDNNRLSEFIDDAMAHMPAERKILRHVVRALRENGTPVRFVFDGEEEVEVHTLRDIQMQVFNLDDAYLFTESGSWVRLVLGNEWDTLTDYTTDLEDALAPVLAYIERNAD